MSKNQVTTRRVQSIYDFCSQLHDDVTKLYELMVDGTNAEEKAHVENMVSKLNELNLDR